MSQKTRKRFTVTVVEPLEGRAMLSGMSASLANFGVHRIHAQVLRHRLNSNPQLFVPGGPVGTQYMTPARTGAAGRQHGLKHGIANPQVSPVTPLPVAPPATPTTGTRTTSVPVSGLSALGGGGRVALPGGVYAFSQGADPSGQYRLTRPDSFSPTSNASVSSVAVNPTPLAPPGIPGGPSGASSAGMIRPVEPPMPWMFMGATLNTSELAGFTKSVDTFATNYTSGADTTKDTAALDALKSGLGDVALSIWSRQSVVSKDAAGGFKTAADTFASTYTGGTDPAKDAAAWKSLRSGMNTLGAAMTGANAEAWGNGSVHGMERLTSMPDASAGDALLGGVTMLGTLSKTDVASLKTAVDTFSTAYTSGADASKDQAAVLALQDSLDAVTSQYWQAHPFDGKDLPMTAPNASAHPGPLTPASAANATPAPLSFPPGPGRFTRVKSPVTLATTTTPAGMPDGRG